MEEEDNDIVLTRKCTFLEDVIEHGPELVGVDLPVVAERVFDVALGLAGALHGGAAVHRRHVDRLHDARRLVQLPANTTNIRFRPIGVVLGL